MKNAKSKGRPSTQPKKLKDGFYVEVKSKGSAMRAMMYSPDRTGMLETARKYGAFKEVTILGEHRNNQWVNADGVPRKK